MLGFNIPSLLRLLIPSRMGGSRPGGRSGRLERTAEISRYDAIIHCTLRTSPCAAWVAHTYAWAVDTAGCGMIKRSVYLRIHPTTAWLELTISRV